MKLSFFAFLFAIMTLCVCGSCSQNRIYLPASPSMDADTFAAKEAMQEEEDPIPEPFILTSDSSIQIEVKEVKVDSVLLVKPDTAMMVDSKAGADSRPVSGQ